MAATVLKNKSKRCKLFYKSQKDELVGRCLSQIDLLLYFEQCYYLFSIKYLIIEFDLSANAEWLSQGDVESI